MTEQLAFRYADVVDLGTYRKAHVREPRTAPLPPVFPGAPRALSERQVAHRKAMLDALTRARPTRAIS